MNTITRIKNNLIYAYHRKRMNWAFEQQDKYVADMSEKGKKNFVKYGNKFLDSATICFEIPLH